MINVDTPAKKYKFLNACARIEIYTPETLINSVDLALILDTNDGRLVEPLMSRLKIQANETLFIDHHPILAHGPLPDENSLIDTRSASTGQLCYHLLKALGCEFDAEIARALYTSVVFDTQLFRYVKSDPESHLIAADLLLWEKSPEEVHRKLFSNYSVEKLTFLMRAMNRIHFIDNGRAAFIPLRAIEFNTITVGGLDRDESGDVIDQVMNVDSIEVAALLREDAPENGVPKLKLSLRSKGRYEVLSFAEKFGGGGHRFASGAHLDGTFEHWQRKILEALGQMIAQDPDSTRQFRESGS